MFKQWIRCEMYLSNIKLNHLTEFYKSEETQQSIFSKLAGFMPTIAVPMPSCTLFVRAALFEIIIRSNQMKPNLSLAIG